MCFKITEDNPLTYHHIKKKEHGGGYTVENGAPLTQDAQCYLHYIEKKDIGTYEEINKILKEINTQGFGPTENQMQRIEFLMIKFEVSHLVTLQKHKNKTNKLIDPTLERKKRQSGHQKVKNKQKN